MKLHSLRVRNYRIHRDTAVTFASGFTVLTAPNEFGKSTLVEAMHRALFLNHRAGGRAREAMVSRFGGSPEVELCFAADDASWRLRKVFAGGGSAACELTDLTRAQQWRSNEAEERLAQLTGREPASGRASDLDAAWDHLWIWQGKAAGDPLATNDGRAELARALGARADAGGGMALAAGDAALARAVRTAVDAAWTKNRKELLRGSEAGDLEQRADSLRLRRDETQRRRDERLAEARNLQQLRADLAAAQAETTRLAPEIAAFEAEIERLRPIVDAAKGLEPQLEQAKEAAAKFADARRASDNAARVLADASAAATLAATAEAERRAAHEAAKALATSLADGAQQADDARATARRQSDCLRALAELDRCERELAQRRTEAAARAAQKLAVEAAEAELAKALPLTSKDVAAVEKATRELAEAEARLAGAAARLVRTAGDAPLTVDGKPLAVGEAVRVERSIEVAHADGTRLQVQPGGGEFPALSADAGKRRDALRELLAKLGVTDDDDARARADVRAMRQQAFDAAKNQLAALPDPTDELLRLPTRQIQLAAQAKELQQAAGDLPAGADAAAMAAKVGAAEAAAAAAQKAAKAAAQRAEETLGNWQHAVKASADRSAERARAAAFAETAEQAAGPASARDARAHALAEAVVALGAQIEAAKPKAQSLDLVTSKLATATKHAATLGGRIQQLGGAINVHEQQLGGERGEDLDATLDALDADLARAEQAAAAARRRAEADKLLLATLDGIQAEQRERREQPFVDACAVYLAIAHNPGVRIGLVGDDQRRLGLVDRSAAGLGAFDFADLSQGGQELTALAARLAIAEVLAAEQPDRSLPLVLDDSVTNVDPERLRQVGFLLAHAATRGVQVVFATCDTERAGGLRAERVERLSAPTWNGAAPRPAAADAADEPSLAATAGAGTSDGDDARQLADELRAQGGEASTRALRAALAWEKQRFDDARDAAIAAGMVEAPEGSRSLRLRGESP